jgi:TolB protein
MAGSVSAQRSGCPPGPAPCRPWQDVPGIVRADLERSGQLRACPGGTEVMDEMARPNLAPWRDLGADALVTGSVTRLADGRFDVRFRLWDVVKAQDLGG